jgi:hypothetical protein
MYYGCFLLKLYVILKRYRFYLDLLYIKKIINYSKFKFDFCFFITGTKLLRRKYHFRNYFPNLFLPQKYFKSFKL